MNMQHITTRLIVAFVTFIIGVTSTTVLNAFRLNGNTNSAAERELLEVDREYVEAHVQRDTAALDRILADEFTIGPAFGRFANKAQRLALLEDLDFTYLAIDADGVEAQVSGDKGLVTGQAVIKGRHRGRGFISPPYRFTRVYEKRGGDWQLVNVHIFHIGRQ
jgi:ketosteroid isomerase-like protein